MKRFIALAAVFGLLLAACAPGAGVPQPGGSTNVNTTTTQTVLCTPYNGEVPAGFVAECNNSTKLWQLKSAGGTSTNVNVTTSNQPAAAAPAAPGPNTTYVGVPPENAPQAPAVDIGYILVVEDGRPTEYTYDGGAMRWFGMRQTTKGVAKTYEISCSSNEWVWYVDAVSAAFNGRSLFTQAPQVVTLDVCPFERTALWAFDGQIGAVKRSDVQWANRDRNVGFKLASGHTPRLSVLKDGKLTPA